MAKTTIRRATLADVPQMADVFAAGFIDDDVFGRFMHPKRREFPEDWLRYWQKEIRSTIIDPAGVCFVGVDKEGVVKACCLMKKMGAISPSIGKRDDRTSEPEQPTGPPFNAEDDSSFINRAADPKAMAIFEKNWSDIEHPLRRTSSAGVVHRGTMCIS